MNKFSIPKLSDTMLKECLQKAADSKRQRYPKILHQPGDEFNRVFNFMMKDTYMQPHLHQGEEKIEKMYLVQGSFAVLYFNDIGKVEKVSVIEKGGCEYIEIPAFTWHTYIMLKNNVVSYETMMGRFDPKTWKKLAKWAPRENTYESNSYLESLRRQLV